MNRSFDSPVVESVLLRRSDTATASFPAAFAQALDILREAPGYLAHQTGPCMEIDGDFLLLIWWRSLRDHIEGFRQSPGYVQWRQLLDPHVRLSMAVRHYAVTGLPPG